MSALNWGEDAAAVARVAGHTSEGPCSCGGDHNWNQIINAAIAALDRKIAELHVSHDPTPAEQDFRPAPAQPEISAEPAATEEGQS